jgi:hypothetical protein
MLRKMRALCRAFGENGARMVSSTALAYVSGIALVIAAVGVIVLHVGEREMNPIRDAVSLYVHAPLGVLYYVQVIATGVSALALLAALRARGAMHSREGLIALGLYGLSRLAIAAFPTDPKGAPTTDRGRVHLILAVVAFASAAFMTGSLTPALASHAAWSDLAGVLRVASIVTITSAVAVVLRPLTRPIFGLVERGIYLGAFVWLGGAIFGLIR